MPTPGPNEAVLSQIAQLEASITITQRRMREAILGIDNNWLVAVDARITELRKQLK